MSKPVYIVGIGGHARAVASLLIQSGFEVRGYFADEGSVEESIINQVEWIGPMAHVTDQSKVVLANGADSVRKQNFETLNCLKENVIHPSAVIGLNSNLGSSNLIFPNVVLGAEVTLGENNIINTGAILEHEVTVGSHTHVSIGCTIAGRVSIGSECFIGAGSVVKDNVSIADGVTVGAGAVVVKSILEPGTYVGCPAKRIK